MRETLVGRPGVVYLIDTNIESELQKGAPPAPTGLPLSALSRLPPTPRRCPETSFDTLSGIFGGRSVMTSNTLTNRKFIDLIAIFSSYGPIDYSPALAPGDRGNAYVEASIACVREADHKPLRQLLLAGLSREDNT